MYAYQFHLHTCTYVLVFMCILCCLQATYHEKPSAVLPPFPEVKSMTLSEKIPIDKVR